MTKKQVIRKYLLALKKLQKKHTPLLRNIKKRMPKLESLLKVVEDHWGYEDLVYRYYHTSNKLYLVQGLTLKIVEALKSISPHRDRSTLDNDFCGIIKAGTGHKHELFHNQEWGVRGRPMLEAFFHAKYFLEMAVKCGKEMKRIKKAPQIVSSGWASLLTLYKIR